MAKKRKRPRREPESEEKLAPRPARRRGNRWVRRLVLLCLLVVGLVAALPTIVSNTPARDTLLGWAMPEGGWAVTSQQADFSWTGSQSLQGLRVVDAQGNDFLVCPDVVMDGSLLALLADQSKLGQIVIRQPQLHLVTNKDGSNLEDFLAGMSTDEADPPEKQTAEPSSLPALQVEVVDATIHARHEESGQNWSLQQANLSLQTGDANKGLTATCTGQLAADGANAPGKIDLRIQQQSPTESHIKLLAEGLPLEPLQPWLVRAMPGAEIDGLVSADATLLVDQDGQGNVRLRSTGRLEGSGVTMQAEALSGDRIQVASLEAPWEVSLDGNQLQIQRLQLVTDWSQLHVRGSIGLEELAALSIDKLPNTEGSVTGQVKLNRLAAMLPHTLQLREGIRIDSGDFAFSAKGEQKHDGVAWTAGATISNVSGSDGRRAIRWDQPIETKMSLTETPTGPSVQNLSLTSSFASASFHTDDNNISGSFQFDLQRLSNELMKFVELNDWQFQGRGKGSLVFVPQEQDRFQASADVRLSELNVVQNRKLVWAEPQLQVTASATGSARQYTPQQINSAEVHLNGARDRFDAELLQPVDLSQQSQSWKVALEANGPLASWAGRLRPWLEAVPEHVEGEAQLRATVVAAPDQVQVLESSGNLANLKLRDGSMVLDEPRVEFSGDVRWNPASSTFASKDATLLSSTMTFRSAGVLVQLTPDSSAPRAEGTVAFRANLERLSNAAGLIAKADSTWARGLLEGNLQMASRGNQLSAELKANVDQLAVMKTSGANASRGQSQAAWNEPKLQTEGRLVYDIQSDNVSIQKLTAVGQTLRVDGSAGVARLKTSGDLQASGALQYDSQALANLLSAYLGPDVQLQGDRQVRFQLAGSLYGGDGVAAHWSNLWNGSAEAGWTSGNVFGLAVGNGKLQGALQNGELQIAPIDVKVGQGRLTARPIANLSPGAEQIVLPRGPVISNVAISQEVSEAMLKYVAPIVAGATRTQGNFSLDLDEARVPLSEPDQASVLGRLNVHQLQVTPGPMIRDITSIVSKLESVSEGGGLLRTATGRRDVKLLSMSNQQIGFQVQKGRVYHRSLEFLIDDVPVRSSGSVGFDQTLAIDLEVPIQQKWLGKSRAFQSLAGETIRIPVRGTFQRWQVDGSAANDLLQKLLQGTVDQVLGDELNRAFDKLFK